MGMAVKKSLALSRRTIGLVAVASSVLVLSANCVGLNKPSSVATCAAHGTCTDDAKDRSDAGNDGKQNADSGPIADLPPGASAADAAFDARTIAESTDNVDTDAAGGDTGNTRDSASDPSALGDAAADQPLPGDAVPEAQPKPTPEPGPEPSPEPAPEPSRDGGVIDAGNCINQINNSDYVYGSAPGCSACKDNSTLLETKCKGMLDCLAPPSTKADMTYCLNLVGGSQRVSDCVSALTTAACPSGF